MRERPGEVMGYFAHGHPFLDGNGRTIMVVRPWIELWPPRGGKHARNLLLAMLTTILG
jgi:fido (protein-threonine AMPylation protein)